MGGVKVVVYGLSTEGYAIASQMAIKGADVYIIDESTPSAISLKAEIAKTYPNVSSLKEDEPLLAMEPIDVAISKAQYLFFTPRIRKTGQDIKTEIHSKFKDAVTSMKKIALLFSLFQLDLVETMKTFHYLNTLPVLKLENIFHIFTIP